MTDQQKRTLDLAELLRMNDRWTTYGVLGEIVYGPGNGAQTVGNTMRDHGRAESAHRVLQKGGRISPHMRGAAGDPDQAISRLKREALWDTTHNRARPDRFINAAQLRRLEAQ